MENKIPDDLAERSKAFYSEKLQNVLEKVSHGKFIAIEPESESYYVANTDKAVTLAASKAHPNKQFYLTRIGYTAAYVISGYNTRTK